MPRFIRCAGVHHDSRQFALENALIRDADTIVRWSVKPVGERRSFLMERKLFLAAYSLRKLSDDHKLSTATLNAGAPVMIASARKPGFSNLRHLPDRYFDMANLVAREMTWRRVLSLMIHSTVFLELQGDDGRYEGFMVTSDQQQRRGLVQVDLAGFVGLIRQAAEDYPSALRHSWVATENRWVTWTGHDPVG